MVRLPCCLTAAGQRLEALLVYKNGLLVWSSGLGGDFWQGVAGQNVASFISIIYSVTEWMLFARRFYEGILAIDEVSSSEYEPPA